MMLGSGARSLRDDEETLIDNNHAPGHDDHDNNDNDDDIDEFELFRACSLTGGRDLLTPAAAASREPDEHHQQGQHAHSWSAGVSDGDGSSSSGVSTCGSIKQDTSDPERSSSPMIPVIQHVAGSRMRKLKLRKCKSDRDIFSEIRKLRGWSRKEDADQRHSPEGDEVTACLLSGAGAGDDSSLHYQSGSQTSILSSSANNDSIDSGGAYDPDFEVLAACKYKRQQQQRGWARGRMERLVSVGADSGIDIQVTAPSPQHHPSAAAARHRKQRSHSLFLGDWRSPGGLRHSTSLPQALSDTHLDAAGQQRQQQDRRHGHAQQAAPTECEIYRVRSFSTTNNSIVNRGDSFKLKAAAARRQSASQRSLRAAIRRSYFSTDCIAEQAGGAGGGVERLRVPVTGPGGERAVSVDRLYTQQPDDDYLAYEEFAAGCRDYDDAGSDGEAGEDEESAPVFRVAVLGAAGVGKTTITRQLMTSEYLQNSAPDEEVVNNDDDDGDKTVTVQLDEEETVVQFIDLPGNGSVGCSDALVDAYIVVYSVTERNSFQYAHACLQDIRGDRFSSAVVILVANKQDLVRNRVVSEDEGKALAVKCDCKYTEVSAILDHKVAELLVGVVRQVRLHRLRQQQKHGADGSGGGGGDLLRYTGCLQRAAFEIFRRFFRRHLTTTSKSCDNLLIA